MESSKFDNKAVAKGLAPETSPNPHEYLEFLKTQRQMHESLPQVSHVFISVDEKMQRVKDIVEQIANANVPVLITGESGVGKEVIAQMIHQKSNRKAQPFVAVNCAALPPSLLESELFGYEKGAFTGAHQRHIGKFEQANGGTLLLDEVTEIEPALQAKLLRALQEKEIERIGGTGAVKIDTRIIATTNRDIKAIVNEGRFRQDLYYRLYVIHLEIPPLRDRKKDIEALAKFYLSRFCEQFSKPAMRIAPEATARLEAYPWPGNVRELQNVMQRAILMASGDTITASDLPISEAPKIEIHDWISALPIGRPLYEVETHFIIETLRHHQGNRTHAAKTLGISLRTLRNKINEFTALGHVVPQPLTGKAYE